MNLVPMVIEKTSQGERAMDIQSRLLRDRIVILNDEVNHHTAGLIVAQMLYLESEDRTADILFYINSPGGVVTAGMSIYDTMQYVTPDVSTITIGVAASMAAVLMCAGAAGKRIALKHSRIMMHQPSGAIGGQASDIEITVNEIRKLKRELYDVVNLHTGKPVEQIEKDFDRDNWMTAEEAKQYGLIDEVLLTNPKKQNKS